MKSKSLPWLAASTSLLVCACTISFGNDWTSPDTWIEDTRTFEVPAGSLTALECRTHNGGITVSGSETGQISILAKIRAGGADPLDAESCLDALEFTVAENGSTLEVFWTYRERQDTWQADVSFTIQLPSRFGVDARTHNGAIVLSDIQGGAEALTHNGHIEIVHCDQHWDLETHNGPIRASGSPQSLDVETHNGEISVTLATNGPVEGAIQTHNGCVRVALPENISATVECDTHNGGIHVNRQFDSFSVDDDTFHGQLGTQNGKLDIETHNGSIELNNS